jgi:hypothetical protein
MASFDITDKTLHILHNENPFSSSQKYNRLITTMSQRLISDKKLEWLILNKKGDSGVNEKRRREVKTRLQEKLEQRKNKN